MPAATGPPQAPHPQSGRRRRRTARRRIQVPSATPPRTKNIAIPRCHSVPAAKSARIRPATARTPKAAANGASLASARGLRLVRLSPSHRSANSSALSGFSRDASCVKSGGLDSFCPRNARATPTPMVTTSARRPITTHMRRADECGAVTRLATNDHTPKTAKPASRLNPTCRTRFPVRRSNGSTLPDHVTRHAGCWTYSEHANMMYPGVQHFRAVPEGYGQRLAFTTSGRWRRGPSPCQRPARAGYGHPRSLRH